MTDHGRTAVYRMYDAADVLLYVGVASKIGARWDHHAHKQSWWEAVRRQTVVWYDHRSEAALTELDAIHNERPLYNVVGNPDAVWDRRTPEPLFANVGPRQPDYQRVPLIGRHHDRLPRPLPGRGVVTKLLAADVLDRVTPRHAAAMEAISLAHRDIDAMPTLRSHGVRDGGEVHLWLHDGVRLALDAVLEIQGLRPRNKVDQPVAARSLPTQLATDLHAKVTHEVIQAQLSPPYGPVVDWFGQLCQERRDRKIRDTPQVTDDDVRDAIAIVNLASDLLDQMDVF